MAFSNDYPYTDFHEMNLDWILAKVKELTAAWVQTRSDWEDTQQAWEDMKTYINNYFDNLNVQTEINNKLDALVADGTLSELIAPYVASGLPAVVADQIGAVVANQIGAVVAAQISAVVTDQLPAVVATETAGQAAAWLEEHVDPDTGYVIDDTLTITDAAADAKATGDALTELNNALTNNEKKTESLDIHTSYPFSVADKDGNAALIVDEDGQTRLSVKNFGADENGIYNVASNDRSKKFEIRKDGLYDFVVCDGNDNILFSVDNGELKVHALNGISLDTLRYELNKIQSDKYNKTANFDSELNMYIAYGQSWSVGYDAPAISLVAKYDNIMFDTGIKNNPLDDTDIVPISFVPMVEETGDNTTPRTQIVGETPVSAMCSMIHQLIEDENGYKYTDFPYQMFGNAPGYGGQTLAQLKKGTRWYTRLIDQVGYAYNIAASLGKKLVVQAFSWQQEGSIGTGLSGTYAENLEQLRLDIDTDVKAITGQTQTVKCITWQTFPWYANAAKTMYDCFVGASETYEHIICCGASYQFKHPSNSNVHLASADQDWAGAYLGLAYKRSIIDGTKFTPLKPIKATINGSELLVKFNVPCKPLVFDTTTVATISNYGFNIYDANNDEVTIESVLIVSPDTIKIVCDSSLSNTYKLMYGQNAGANYGPVIGNRGNLRDSQGNDIVCIAGNGNKFEVHNWCVVFNKQISELEEV